MEHKKSEAVVTLVCSPQSLACVVIEPNGGGSVPFSLYAYERYEFSHLELESLILFNPTLIARHIARFFQKYLLHDPFVLVALHGPLLFERYQELTTRSAHRSDFSLAELKGKFWDYRYLYPTEHGNSVFFVAGLPLSLVAQYQIFAARARINLVGIIPASLALLQVYQYQYGTAFRRTQLAVDMIQHHNVIDYLCSPDMLARMVRISKTMNVDGPKDIKPILVACGLLISEGMEHEKY